MLLIKSSPSDLALLGHLPFSMGRSREHPHRRDNEDARDASALFHIAAATRLLWASDIEYVLCRYAAGTQVFSNAFPGQQ